MTAERRRGAGRIPVSSTGAAESAARAAALAAYQDFLVDTEEGKPFGVVDDVVLGESGRPVALLVAVGWFGRQVVQIALDQVLDVDQDERRLVVVRGSASRSARDLPERKST